MRRSLGRPAGERSIHRSGARQGATTTGEETPAAEPTPGYKRACQVLAAASPAPALDRPLMKFDPPGAEDAGHTGCWAYAAGLNGTGGDALFLELVCEPAAAQEHDNLTGYGPNQFPATPLPGSAPGAQSVDTGTGETTIDFARARDGFFVEVKGGTGGTALAALLARAYTAETAHPR
jgi:hypothetical protein